MPRNYRREYDNYHSSPEQKKNRAERNRARAKAVKSGAASKGDGKDVHHVKPLKKGGKPGRTKVVERSTNRAHGGRIGDRAGKGKRK